MTELSTLWLPILLSAVFIFIASSVIHTVMPWHHGDYARLPDEEAARAAIGPLGIPPGDYLLPKPMSAREMGSPEYRARLDAGPVMVITAMPNRMTPMGPIFVQWFVYLLIVSLFAAYVAASALAPGAARMEVWRLTGTMAVAGYFLAAPQTSIWYHKKWSTTWKQLFDSLIYAAITAVTFGWLWPQV